MATITYLGKSYECATALKGGDYIHLLDSNGDIVAAFDGISDFSGFSITNGQWTTPTADHDCFVAVVKDDGTMGKGGHRCSDVLSKSGGTVTGWLTAQRFLINSGDGYPALVYLDSNGKQISAMHTGEDTHRTYIAQTATDTNYQESYMLPTVSTGLTASKSYALLTSKNPVTVAQGGTGATDAATARANLGAVSKAGDTMTGQLTATQFNASIGSGYTIMCVDRSGKTSFILQQDPATSRVQIMQIHPNSTASERYRLPYAASGMTADTDYDILTSKSAVTIAQGGTGATTAAQARANLGAQAALGFTPLQQGGGIGQNTNKLYIGWATDGSGVKVQVDTTDMGYLATIGDNVHRSIIYSSSEPTGLGAQAGKIWLKPVN